ncbi:MAG: 6-bladed beta-propeller [Saprospiraceae bacterium]
MYKSISIFFLVTIFACQNKNLDENIFPCKLVKNTKLIQLESIIDSIHYILLKEDIYIHPGINSAFFFDSLFVFNSFGLDFRSKLYVYDYFGNFLRKIVPTGKGPLEVNRIDSFCKKNDTSLLISDITKSSIFEYDLIEGKVINEWKLDKQLKRIYYVNEKLYGLSVGNDNGLFHIYARNMNHIFSGISGPDHYNFMPSRKPFHEINNELFHHASFSDTIYRISSHNQIIPLLKFGDGENSIHTLATDQILDLFLNKQDQIWDPTSTLQLSMGSLSGNDEYFFVQMFNNSLLFFDRKKNICYSTNKRNIADFELISSGGYFNNHNSQPEPFFSDIALRPDFIKSANSYIQNHENSISESLKKLLSNDAIHDNFENPVLARIYFKDKWWHQITNGQ